LPKAACDIIARAGRLTMAGNSLLFIALVIGVGIGTELGLIERPWVILLGLVILPLSAVLDFQAYLARSYRLIALAIAPKDVLWRVISLAIIGIFIAMTGRRQIPLDAAFGILVAVLVALILIVFLISVKRYHLPSLADVREGEPDGPTVEQWRNARVPLWIASISTLAFSNVDVMITAAVLGPEAAAIYFAANRIALAPNFFAASYIIVVGPHLSERYTTGDTSGATRAARLASVEIFLPTLATCLVLALFGHFVLQAFGPAYRAAFPTLCILLAAATVQTAFGIGDVVLNMCGGERASMRIGTITLPVGIALTAALGALWGANGVATGILLTVTWRRWLFWVSASRDLGMRLDMISILVNWLKGPNRFRRPAK
jgi:O-antigen/teichoic acid export membrane protein